MERRNVERSIVRNFKIANIKITKDELFVSFIVKFVLFFYKLFKQPKNLMILSNCKILIFRMVKFKKKTFSKLLIFENYINFKISNI